MALRAQVVRTFRLSKTFDAPMEFVYEWCTDFRGENEENEASIGRRSFREVPQQQFVWAVRYSNGKRFDVGVRAIWLHPPDSWYLDASGQGKEVGAYKLTREDKERTRLEIELTMTYDDPAQAEDEEEWKREWDERWSGYKQALEKDYQKTVRG